MPENPFDDADGQFLVLVNFERQYSLWPVAVTVPAGWDIAARGARAECLAHVEREWLDLRPASLIAAMAEPAPRD